MQHDELKLVPASSAPLTEEEIAAIDEAGAKGPPGSVLAKVHKNKYILFAALLLAVLIVVLVECGARRS